MDLWGVALGTAMGIGIGDGDWGAGAWCSRWDAVSNKKYWFERLAVTNVNKSQPQ